jgi:pyruvate/2-oxoglutarate dehydrogenase complex dihydrolipoamide acyltransferase (E2) component
VTAALRIGRRKAAMHGLIEVDVTEAKHLVGAHDPPLSFTAFVVATVARAAAAHPEVHAYRDWRGRVVSHRHVDVGTIVEVPTAQGVFPLVHLLRDADVRTVGDLSAEIRTVQRRQAPGIGRAADRAASVAARVPGLMGATYALMERSVRARQRIGTVAVTAVGMFGGGGGFGVAHPTLMSLQIVVGGVSERPRVVDGRIAVRQVLDLTITIDHAVVDGAPAARFAADLRARMEHPGPMLGELGTPPRYGVARGSGGGGRDHAGWPRATG